jgi:hypothetical protein
MRKWIVVIAALALLAPAVARAHEGHAHKVMGTIAAVDGSHVTVKATDGKTVMVMLDGKTKVTQGKAKLEPSALKVGDRIVAEGPEQQKMIMATSVRVGERVTAAKK